MRSLCSWMRATISSLAIQPFIHLFYYSFRYRYGGWGGGWKDQAYMHTHYLPNSIKKSIVWWIMQKILSFYLGVIWHENAEVVKRNRSLSMVIDCLSFTVSPIQVFKLLIIINLLIVVNAFPLASFSSSHRKNQPLWHGVCEIKKDVHHHLLSQSNNIPILSSN